MGGHASKEGMELERDKHSARGENKKNVFSLPLSLSKLSLKINLSLSEAEHTRIGTTKIPFAAKPTGHLIIINKAKTIKKLEPPLHRPANGEPGLGRPAAAGVSGAFAAESEGVPARRV